MKAGECGKARTSVGHWQNVLLGAMFAGAGTVGYLVTMAHAGSDASLLEAFTSESLLASASAAALLIGVAAWVSGNFSALQQLARMPRRDER